PAGVVTTVGGAAGIVGSADGTGNSARFSYPLGVAVDSAGNLYVSDQNQTLRKGVPTPPPTPSTCNPGRVIWVDAFSGIRNSDLDGASQQLAPVFGPFNGGVDVAINPLTGKIYWGDNSTTP